MPIGSSGATRTGPTAALLRAGTAVREVLSTSGVPSKRPSATQV